MIAPIPFPRRARICRLLLSVLVMGWPSMHGWSRGWAAQDREPPFCGVRVLLDSLGANVLALESDKHRVERFAADLAALDPKVNKREARILAECTQASMNSLRREYRVVWPPVLHMFFIYYGRRERGCCFHWTDDLYARLKLLKLRTLILGRAIANEDGPSENNCLVVGVRGRPFHEMLLIDGWRFSGRLVWRRVSKDYYPWRPYAPNQSPRAEKLREFGKNNRPGNGQPPNSGAPVKRASTRVKVPLVQ